MSSLTLGSFDSSNPKWVLSSSSTVSTTVSSGSGYNSVSLSGSPGYTYTVLSGLTVGTVYTVSFACAKASGTTPTAFYLNVFDGTIVTTIYTTVPSNDTSAFATQTATFPATATTMMLLVMASSAIIYVDTVTLTPSSGVSNASTGTGVTFASQVTVNQIQSDGSLMIGDFENWIWAGTGVSQDSTYLHHTGTKSLKMLGAATAYLVLYNLSVGTTYTISFWYAYLGGNYAQTFVVNTYDGTTVNTIFSQAPPANNDRSVSKTCTFVAAASKMMIVFIGSCFYGTPATVASSIFVDTVTIQPWFGVAASKTGITYSSAAAVEQWRQVIENNQMVIADFESSLRWIFGHITGTVDAQFSPIRAANGGGPSDAYHGTGQLWISNNNWSGYTYAVLTGLDTSTSYTISFYAKHDVDALTYLVNVYDGTTTTTLLNYPIPGHLSTTNWYQYSTNSFTPTNTNVILSFYGYQTSGNLYLDYVTLYPYSNVSVSNTGVTFTSSIITTNNYKDPGTFDSIGITTSGRIAGAFYFGPGATTVVPAGGAQSGTYAASLTTTSASSTSYLYTVAQNLQGTAWAIGKSSYTCYFISFYMAKVNSSTAAPTSFYVNVFDGTNTSTVYYGTASSTSWTQVNTAYFASQSSKLMIVFVSSNSGNSGILIDSVVVNASQSPSGVTFSPYGITYSSAALQFLYTLNDFENVSTTTDIQLVNNTLQSWYYSANAGVANWAINTYAGTPPMGQMVGIIQTTSAATQGYIYTILQNLSTSQTYTISFYTAQQTSVSPPDTFGAYLYDGTSTIPIYSGVPSSTTFTPCTGVPFTPSSTTLMLLFAANASTSTTILLSQIRVDKYIGLTTSGVTYSSSITNVPSPPQNLSVSVSTGQAALTWDAPASTNGKTITGYSVTYAFGGSSVTTTTTNTSITLSGLTSGFFYTFYVSATTSGGTGGVASQSVPIGSKPTTPSNLSSTPGNGFITLAWTGSTIDDGTSLTYTVAYTSGGSTTYVANIASTSTSVTGLTNNVTYTFTVQAVSSIGIAGDASSSVTGKPNIIPIPSAVGSPTGTAGNGTIALSWTAPSYALSYNITYGTGTGGSSATITGVNTTSYTLTGLTGSVAYSISISAVNDTGTGNATTISVTPNSAAPDPPTSLAGSAGSNGTIPLTWSAPANNNGAAVTGYVVTYISDSGTTATQNASSESTTLSGLTGTVSYTISVAAVNTAGTSTSSSTITVTALTPPYPPTNLSATTGDGTISITYTAPSNNGGSAVTGYRITYQDTTVSGGTQSVTTASTSYTIQNLLGGDVYSIAVAAVSTLGTGSSCSPITSTPTSSAPPAPTLNSLTAGTGTNAGTLVAAWTPPSTNNGAVITSYTLTYNTTVVTGLSGSSTSYTITGLMSDTSYTVSVAAVNAVDTGASSSSLSATPNASGPAAPTGLASTPDINQLALAWTAPTNVRGAVVQSYTVRYTPSGGSTTTITGVTDVSYTITGLTGDKTYTISVAAVNSAGTGDYTSNISSTPTTVHPGAPTSLAGTPGNGTIDVSYSAPSDTGGAAITSYIITYVDTVTSQSKTLTVASVLYGTIPSLVGGHEYTISVQAINKSGAGTSSSTISVTPNTAPPNPPTALACTAALQSISVSFTAPTNNNGAAVSGYVVTYVTGTTSASVTISTTSTVITGLTGGLTYSVTVASVNSAGTGSDSSAVTAVPLSVPGPPASLTGTPGNGTLTVSWSVPTNTGGSSITRYTVTCGASTYTTSSSSYVITGLTGGVSYTVEVTATNSTGTGTSSSVTVVPTTAPPNPPTGLAGTAGSDGSISLTWTAPANNNGAAVTSYTLAYTTGGTTRTVTSINTTSYTLTGLTGGSSYSINMAAVNTAGTGTASGNITVTAHTPPGPPTSLTGTPGNGSLTVSWSAPSNNGGGSVTQYTVTQGS